MHACFALKSTINGWDRLVMVIMDSLEVCAFIFEALGAFEEMNFGGGQGGYFGLYL